MNYWARMLGDLPVALQRAIARAQRVSLPRGCTPAVRHRRLRQALCRAASVRATYAQLDPAVQAAVQELRTVRGGLSPAELQCRYGPIRAARRLAADPRPRSVAEQLVVLGWLLLRPAAPQHPPRYLLPPELRRWLPQPFQVMSYGPAPTPAAPSALRAATTFLLACADAPLHLRHDGRLRRASVRRLAARLAPTPATEAHDLVAWLVPLLCQAQLVEPRGSTLRLTLAGQRFLTWAPAVRLDLLRHAWQHAPTPDLLLARLLPDRTGLDWPVLRRRLCDWIAAMPADQLLDPATLYAALAAHFGPLADATTHGFRTVDRAPWQPKRAQAVFEAALHGPLRWLGYVEVSVGEGVKVWRCGNGASSTSPHRHISTAPWTHSPISLWRYARPGEVVVPHAAADADVLRLLPFADWQAADDTATIYRITPATLGQAARAGWDASTVWALLERRAGPRPATWQALRATRGPQVQIMSTVLVLTDTPAVLDRAARSRTVQRYLTRLAPGIARTRPEHVGPLQRALARQQVSAQAAPLAAPAIAEPELGREKVRRDARPNVPRAWTPGECAALALACAFYRQHAPPDAPLLPHDQLEQQLCRGLPRPLRAALDDAYARLVAPAPVLSAAASGPPLPLATTVQHLQQAVRSRQPITFTYQAAAAAHSTCRTVRPLSVEQQGDQWYLRAYCTARRAERTFRVDRIAAVRVWRCRAVEAVEANISPSPPLMSPR